MSIMQRLTLIGLYNYDNTLFDGLTLPEQYDKSTFIESLMIEHGEKLVLYSDYDFMKYSISAWGRKWALELTRIAEALQAEYNPIWNYDRYEEWKDKGGKQGTSETNGNHNEKTISEGVNDQTNSQTTIGSMGHVGQSTTNSTTTTEADSDSSHKLINTPDYSETTTNENVTSANVEHLISADNSSDYQPESKDITDSGKQKTTMEADGVKDDISERNTSKTNTEEIGNIENGESFKESNDVTSSGNNSINTKNNSSTSANNKTKTIDSEKNSSDHVGHMWGNIGVTTSAAMVTEVVEQRMKYNLYNTACRLFANELLIGIY